MEKYRLQSEEHRTWARGQAFDLLRLYQAGVDRHAGGFLPLDIDGKPFSAPRWLYQAGRMTFCYALAAMLGFDGASDITEHGLAVLRGPFHDDSFGGWYTELADDGHTVADDSKMTYAHAFVLLASATARRAGFDCKDLLDEASKTYFDHLWDPDAGLARESWDRGWTTTENYRGLNSNMHTVEAFLAAYRATNDDRFHDDAESACVRMIEFASDSEWRIPEHFTATWQPRPEFNADNRSDPFRPYGATPGHGLEWARLIVELSSSTDEPADPSLMTATVALFDRAVADGWLADGTGFAYTTDWSGKPVVTARLHWPLTEAIGAARALHRATGDARFADWYSQFWQVADEIYVDHLRGGWYHEVGADKRPSASVWQGKPDLYHALQACLVERL